VLRGPGDSGSITAMEGKNPLIGDTQNENLFFYGHRVCPTGVSRSILRGI